MMNLLQLLVFIVVHGANGDDEIIYVHVGEEVKLNMQQSNPNYYVRWVFGTENGLELADINYLGRNHVYRDADIWKNKLFVSPSQLTIKNMQEGNFGTIVCIMSDNKPIKSVSSKTFRLIKVNVSMDVPSPVIPGNYLSLKCNVDNQRKLTINWLTPKGSIKNADKGALRQKATSQDNGEWTCVVRDGKEHKFKIFVSVVDFSSTPVHIYTSTNLPLNVPFLITPDKFVQQIPSKIKEVVWFFNPKTSLTQQTIFSVSPNAGRLEQGGQDRELRHENFTKDGHFSLYRNLARTEDRGSYNCSITFDNGYILSRAVVVDVLQIIPSPGTELISGSPLNLSCSTGGPLKSNAEVKWFPPKSSSLANAELPSGHLIINRVGTEDSGKWRCELKQNTTTLTSAEITLKIDPILTVWMVVTICGAGVILILLTILAFTLYRRRQRKMRQFRHRLCQCKNPKPKGFYKA